MSNARHFNDSLGPVRLSGVGHGGLAGPGLLIQANSV